MDKETLETILGLQKKVDMYERAFLDLAFALDSDKTMIVPKHDDEVVSMVFQGVFELRKFYLQNAVVQEPINEGNNE